MKEKITLSRTCQLTTIVVSVIIYLPAAALLSTQNVGESTITFLITSTLLLLCIPLSPKSIELTDEMLIIHKYAGQKKIPYSLISSVAPYSTRSIKEIRIWGIGGFIGYTGSFYNRRIGKYQSYVGNYNEAFLITLKTGKKYVISCRNHQNVISTLQKEVHQLI